MRRLANDRGGAEVELAILGPLLLIIIFGAIQITTYFTARGVALAAAQVAVSAERRVDGQGTGEARGEAFLARAGDWLVDSDVGEPRRSEDVASVTVTVTGRAPSILFDWPITQTAQGTVERFTELP